MEAKPIIDLSEFSLVARAIDEIFKTDAAQVEIS